MRAYATRSYTARAGSGIVLHLGDSTTQNDSLLPRAYRWPSLLEAYLDNLYQGSWWTQKEGASNSFYGGFSPGDVRNNYANWSGIVPNLVIINLVFNAHIGSDAYPSGTYASDTVSEQAYIDDVSSFVDHFVNLGVSKSHILILMRAPGNVNWSGGSGAAKFTRWNSGGGSFPDGICTPTALVTGGAQTSANGCVFVPMADVYGAGYDPVTDPDDMILDGDANNLHPSVLGNDAWYERISDYLPADLVAASTRTYTARSYATRSYA